MFRVPDVPPRPFEIRLAQWIMGPLLAVFFAALLVQACDIRDGRRHCERSCAATGVSDFIYVPGDARAGREAECICRNPSADASEP